MENELVKKIILDTDMGVDCDDAVALAILLNKHIAGEIQIGCITASSTREGATATVQAITNYYGVHLPIGAMASPSLECDKINNYGKAVKDLRTRFYCCAKRWRSRRRKARSLLSVR